MSTKITVANLPADAAEEAVHELLSRFVEVRSVRMVRSGSQLAGSCDCVAEVRDGSRVERAVRALDGQYFRGRLLSVDRHESGARLRIVATEAAGPEGSTRLAKRA